MSGKITNKLPLGLAGCLFVVIGAIVAVGLIVAFSYRDKERDESASITCSRWPVLYDNRYLEPFGEASVLYSHPDLHALGHGDSISSLCVPDGWSITLYEDRDYQGRALELPGPVTIPDLSEKTDGHWNWHNEASSVRLNFRPPSPKS